MKTLMLLIIVMSWAAPASAAPPATCAGPNAVDALATLVSGAQLHVERGPDRVVVSDRAGERLLIATCEGVTLPLTTALAPPRRGAPARVVILRGTDGTALVTRGVTSRGARSLDIAPGVVGRAGLSALSFDNDDAHLADDAGALLFAVSTAPDGTLTRRSATDVEIVHPDGSVHRP